jgi:hypothetical protein
MTYKKVELHGELNNLIFIIIFVKKHNSNAAEKGICTLFVLCFSIYLFMYICI